MKNNVINLKKRKDIIELEEKSTIGFELSVSGKKIAGKEWYEEEMF